MGLLTRTVQFGAKVNSSEGVATALVAADFAMEFKNDTFTREVTQYQRGVRRPGLSNPKDILGGAYGKVAVDVEMIGGGAGTAAREPWYDLMQACGMGMTTLKKIVCAETSLSDKFVAGSTFGNNAVAGSATHVGRIEWVGIVATHVNIVYKPITGTFADADVLTGYHAGGAGSTLTENGAPVDAGKCFEPLSETASQVPADLTVEWRDGEDVNRLVGARGDVELTFNFGEVPIAKFSLEGPRVMQTYPGVPIRAGFVSSVPAVAAPTYLQGTVGLPLLLDAHSPIVDQVSLKLGNTLTPRKTVSAGGVIAFLDGALPGGYAATRITDRKPMLTINPDRPGFATYDWYQKWQQNSDIALYIQNGILTTTGQSAIIVRGGDVTIDAANMADQDKNGVRAISGDLKFNGNNDDELAISHVFI